MSSRLASLLVQEGLVSAKRMADAFQRQVIYGGTLDTILLEMDLVEEPAILEALGRANQLPGAGDLPNVVVLRDSGILTWLPHGSAEKYRVAPIDVDGNILRVVVTDPVDRKLLDELGFQCRRSIDPLITVEYRFFQAWNDLYGIALPARYASLAARVKQRNDGRSRPTAPAGRAVVTDVPMPRPSSSQTTPAVSSQTTPVVTEPARPRPSSSQDAAIIGARTQSETSLPIITPRTPSEPRIPVITARPPSEPRIPVITAPVAEVQDPPTARLGPERQAGAPEAPIPPQVTVRLSSGAPPGASEPLELEEALDLLDGAQDRDVVFEILCRAARSLLPFSAVFTIHSDLAIPRLALHEKWLDRELLARVSVPLEKPSPFRATVEGRASYLGRIGLENAAAAALAALDRPLPTGMMLLPLIMRDRAVALLYADAAGASVDTSLLAGITNVVGAASRAFQRLILRAKSGEFRTTTATIGGDGKVEGKVVVTSPPPAQTQTGTWQAASPITSDAKFRPTQPRLGERFFGNDSRPVDPADLVAVFLRGGEPAASAAEALVALGEAGAQAVVAALPGPLNFDRHALRGPVPPLAEHGPLLGLVTRLAAFAAPALARRLNDPSLDMRYYAALAAGDIRAPELVRGLGNRLFDPDASVRAVAALSLRKYDRGPEVETLFESLRGELPGPDALRQRFAAEAAGALGDVLALPRLIELVKHFDESVSMAAHRALVEITKQDFGTSRWRWRGWWERHRHEPRTEWLLEGLSSGDTDIRRKSYDELKPLLPAGYTFDPDGQRREREDARRHILDWWRSKHRDVF